MQQSGHKQDFREVVFKRAVEKYIGSLRREEEGSKQMYRTKKERAEQSKEDGGLRKTKTGWYKALGYHGTVVVPATMDSTLMKTVDEALKKTDSPGGYKLLVQEDGGRTMASQLVKSNPFPQTNCGRPKCGMCLSGDGEGKCWKSNVVYKIQCARQSCRGADGEGPVFTYIGESSRSCFTRGLEHQDAYIKKKDSSFMWRHTEMCHGGNISNMSTDYTYSVIETHRSSLNRILGEAVQIQAMTENPKELSLNSRLEYFTPQMVRPIFVKGPGE